MSETAKIRKIGNNDSCADHDHDLVHDLGRRLDAVWRYDQYIENARGHESLQRFWERLRDQEQENISNLKRLIRSEIEQNCF